MDRIDIDTWANISADGWSSQLLGNGASIAIHKEFAYPILHGIADAKGLLATTAQYSRSSGQPTSSMFCSRAGMPCMSTGHWGRRRPPSPQPMRTLIEAVHPVHAVVATDLQRVGAFASAFPTVVSLKYDFTLYWAMLLFNAAHGSWFKDAFHDGEFQTDWEYLRRPYGHAAGATLVFYPHGSLAVARDYLGDETKLAVGARAAGELLGTITRRWTSGHYVPVFVSE